MERISKYEPFENVFGGQRFIDMKTNKLCRKLHDQYVPLEVANGSKAGDGYALRKDVILKHTYNAIVESTGKLIYIDPQMPVQLFF